MFEKKFDSYSVGVEIHIVLNAVGVANLIHLGIHDDILVDVEKQLVDLPLSQKEVHVGGLGLVIVKTSGGCR